MFRFETSERICFIGIILGTLYLLRNFMYILFFANSYHTLVARLTAEIVMAKYRLHRKHKDKANAHLLRTRIKNRRGLLNFLRQNDFELFENVCKDLRINFDPTEAKPKIKDDRIRVRLSAEKQCNDVIEKKLDDFKKKLLEETDDFANNQFFNMAQEIFTEIAKLEIDSESTDEIDKELIKFKNDYESYQKSNIYGSRSS
ncbi:MAG: Ribosomal_S15 [Paramarteilia canceri]